MEWLSSEKADWCRNLWPGSVGFGFQKGSLRPSVNFEHPYKAASPRINNRSDPCTNWPTLPVWRTIRTKPIRTRIIRILFRTPFARLFLLAGDVVVTGGPVASMAFTFAPARAGGNVASGAGVFDGAFRVWIVGITRICGQRHRSDQRGNDAISKLIAHVYFILIAVMIGLIWLGNHGR
jgi:hypothetical protein